MERNLSYYLSRTKPNGDCLIWQGAQTPDGYPRGAVDGNKNTRLHRYIYFLIHGEYPEVVRHTCDNPLCIQPDHLVGGTPTDNIRDRSERFRTHRQRDLSLVERVVELRSNGLKYQDIADQLDITYKQVDAWLYRARKDG